MSSRYQLWIIVSLLIIAGAGAAVYKNRVLDFPFLPGKHASVWTVEAVISFTAEGGPVEVSMHLPYEENDMAVMDADGTASGYTFKKEKSRVIWRSGKVEGAQKIRFRMKAYRNEPDYNQAVVLPEEAVPQAFEKAFEEASKAIVSESVQEKGGTIQVTKRLLDSLNSPDNPHASQLLKQADAFGGKLNLAKNLLQLAGVRCRSARGLWLGERERNQQLRGYLEVFVDNRWVLIDPRTAEIENKQDILIWQHNDESLLELRGGKDSKIKFSTVSGKVPTRRAAIEHGKYERSPLIDFSIYSLPIADQNTFKLLLLIPIGALVVVVFRNLVGIVTTGTFMPILLAMVLLQTSLLAGVCLFVVVVGIGLILRSYLSHLNLLLVPRISAVLVFVILIYIAISVIGIKLGFETGLQVTFFPMIIISWTIERMSVIWEEEGPREVLIQGGGSLLSASIIFLVMKNGLINHLVYYFPELLLVVLAIIIMIGSYSGYRLTELRRFEPLVKK